MRTFTQVKVSDHRVSLAVVVFIMALSNAKYGKLLLAIRLI